MIHTKLLALFRKSPADELRSVVSTNHRFIDIAEKPPFEQCALKRSGWGRKLKRKQYSKEFKSQVIKEAEEVGNNSIVARKHDLSASMVNRCVRERHGSKNPLSMTNIKAQRSSSDPGKLSAENYKLKKIIGESNWRLKFSRIYYKNRPGIPEKIECTTKWISLGYDIRLVLRIVQLSHSTTYYYPLGPVNGDQIIGRSLAMTFSSSLKRSESLCPFRPKTTPGETAGAGAPHGDGQRQV